MARTDRMGDGTSRARQRITPGSPSYPTDVHGAAGCVDHIRGRPDLTAPMQTVRLSGTDEASTADRCRGCGGRESYR